MPRIFITRRLPGDPQERIAREGHEVDVWQGELPPSREELLARAHGAEGLITLLTEQVDAELLDALPALKVVSNYAVGSDNIDLDAAKQRGVAVGVTPDVLTEATADLAWALLLAAARRLAPAAADVRAGRWRTWEPQGWIGHDVHGAALLVVGAGRIGQAVAKRGSGFDMRVSVADIGDDLLEMLPEADFVSLHVPLTDSTTGLISARELQAMKPTAILVNTARGPVIDRDALAGALHAGAIGGAALDVTVPEPLPADDPLLRAPNLLVVPHIGSATQGARAAMTDRAVRNLLAGLAGEPVPYPAGA
jgi:glyoxylate reductase